MDRKNDSCTIFLQKHCAGVSSPKNNFKVVNLCGEFSKHYKLNVCAEKKDEWIKKLDDKKTKSNKNKVLHSKNKLRSDF